VSLGDRGDRLSLERLVGHGRDPRDERLVPLALLFGNIAADPLTRRWLAEALQHPIQTPFMRPFGDDLAQIRTTSTARGPPSRWCSHGESATQLNETTCPSAYQGPAL
jgi:hypothetical protein